MRALSRAPRHVAAALLLFSFVSPNPAEPQARSSATQGPVATRRLVQRLAASGRAEAALRQTVIAAGETLRADRGRIALEPPDRMRLDFTQSGERLTVRGDGGEWLQPSTRQLLVLPAEQAAHAVGLWQVLMEGRGDQWRERGAGARRYRLTPRRQGESLADSLDVRLGADQLPARIEAWVGDQRFVITLSGWRFARPKGAGGFTLRAPSGYAVVRMP